MTVSRALVAVVVVLVCAGCGSPSSGTARTVPADDVPYGLLSPAPSDSTTAATDRPGTTSPQLYLLGDDDLLVPTALAVDARGLEAVVRQLLARLSNGPNETQRELGLASALGPDVVLRLEGLTGSTVRVDVTLPNRGPVADRLPLAVGQIVLTLTSVAGVGQVLLVRDDEPLEMALPGGARTTEPVGALDYQALVAPGSPPVPKAEPGPTTTPSP